jgi:hypothetical protein
MPTPEIHVGVLVAHSPEARTEPLRALAEWAASEAGAVLDRASEARWRFHDAGSTRLSTDDVRHASAFLGEGSLRMAEGPYDALVVVTDVGLLSKRERLVAGLPSPLARMAVVSTRELCGSPRGAPVRTLEEAAVRWNGAALLLHLLGHVAGLEHADAEGGDAVMAPFAVDPERRAVPTFGERSRGRLARIAPGFPERTDEDEGTLSEIAFHLSSAARHPRRILKTVGPLRGLLLPFRLPRLATAAVAPAFILVFTAEIWDAGFHMTDPEVWTFAVFSVLASSIYLPTVLHLLLPRKEKRFHTEHLAVVNVVILLSIVLAVVGLFAMLVLLMLFVQIFVFPPDLVREWPSLALGSADIGFPDQLRIAALISTIGLLTGTLAGGLESRDVLRHMGLFRRRP